VIGSATVDGTERQCYWQAWEAHGRLYLDTPGKVLPPGLLTDRLLTFAVAVREGKYGLGNQVKVQSIAKALRLVSQKLILGGHPDPRRTSPAQQALDLLISRLLKKYSNEDPPAEPKLAIPITTITSIVKNYRWTLHLSAVADLVIIAFFYLLRVGEYTSTATPRQKRTIPLLKCDVRLWHKGQVLSQSAGLEALLRANSTMICIANMKNGTKGAVVHHDAFGGIICSVAALARRIANVQAGPAQGPLNRVTICWER